MVMDEEIDLDALKCYSAPDILICGNCRYVDSWYYQMEMKDINIHNLLL